MTQKIITIDGPIGNYGYSKQFIRNELAGNTKNPVLVRISSLGGEVDDALNIFDQFVGHGICMSQYWCKKYLQDKRAQGFYQNKSDQDINTGIDFTPLKIKGLASMVETNDIFCTPSENFLHVSPATVTKNTFKLEESKRSVAVLGDWSEGLGFGINQAVWTNIPKTI